MSEGRYCYSTDEEYFVGNFDTREEALQEGRDCEEPGTAIYTGLSCPRSFMSYFDTENFLDWISDNAQEEVGDVADGWLKKVSEEALGELRGFLAGWAEKHGLNPKFFAVERVEEHAPDGDSESLNQPHKGRN